MLGLFGSSLSYLIYGFTNSFAGLLISRAVHGACAATISTAQAYVADTTEESKRAHAMGMIGAAFGLGFVLGPAVGGLLGTVSLRTPVLFAAALTFANLIFAAIWLPESRNLRDARAGPIRSRARYCGKDRATDRDGRSICRAALHAIARSRAYSPWPFC